MPLLQFSFTPAFTKSRTPVQIQSTSAYRIYLRSSISHLNYSGNKLALLMISDLGGRALCSLPIAYTTFASYEAPQNQHLTSYAYKHSSVTILH